jgi:hypothetical protein
MRGLSKLCGSGLLARGLPIPSFRDNGRDGGPDSASAALSKMADQDWLEGHTGSHSQDDPDGLRDAGVHRDLANMIQGHTAGDEASKYGSSELPSQKREAAEHVWKFLLAK